MICPNCRKEIPDGSKFCSFCGAALEKTKAPETVQEEQGIKGKKVTKNIVLCPDGIYRWVYEMPMLKNPTILFTVWKVLGIGFGAVFLVMILGDLFRGGNVGKSILGDLKILGIMVGIFLVISLIAYWIVSIMYHGRYTVLFEMDDKSVTHNQVTAQHDKAELVGKLTALVGISTGNLAAAGLGLNVAYNSSRDSVFTMVKSLKIREKRHVIYVNHTLMKNQVYAEDEDFDFVRRFIEAHCPQAKIK